MKKLFPFCLVAAETLMLVLLPTLYSSCSDDPDVSITSPADSIQVTELTSIGGNVTMSSSLGLETVYCTLTRLSDGLTWNGSSWGGGGRLSCTPHAPSETWELSADLPAATSDPYDGLVPGQYHILAEALYSTTEGDEISKATKVFNIGVSPAPVVPVPLSWGENTHGELGAGAGPDSNLPRLIHMNGVLEGKLVVMMAAGERHSLALTSEGKVYAWGDNDRGQLGRGTGNVTPSAEPVAVDASGALAGKFVEFIAAGDDHSLAVTTDGLVFAWGANDRGQLGDGASTALPVSAPVAVLMSGALNGKQVLEVAAGGNFSIARTKDQYLYSWGDNEFGQLGKGDSGAGTGSAVPVVVTLPPAIRFRSIEAGKAHTLAIGNDRMVYAWGRGDEGRLGTGGETQRNVPTLAGTGSPLAGKVVTAVSAGRSHSLALSSAGKVYSWGNDAVGQLGDGSGGTFLAMPVEVGGALAGEVVTFIGAGGYFSIACTSDDEVFGWGENTHGNLAGATAIPLQTDAPVEAAFGAVLSTRQRVLQMSCGLNHGLMLTGPPPLPVPAMSLEAYVNGQMTLLADGSTLNLGSHGVGSQTRVYIVVRNTGSSDLQISNADVFVPATSSLSDHYYSYASSTPLAPGASTGFYMFYEPKTPAAHNGEMRILTNIDPNVPFKITFQGNAYPADENDPAFSGTGANGAVKAFAVQPDGKVLVGGSFTSLGGSPRNRIARLNGDGLLDNAFNPDADGEVACVVVQPDGKIVLGGSFHAIGGITRHLIARLNADGTLDSGFDPDAGLTGQIRALALQGDGRLLLAGSFASLGGSGGAGRSRLARVQATGAVDPAFTPDVSDEVRCVALTTGGSILIGGSFLTVGGEAHPRVARLQANGSVDSAFNAQVNDGMVNCIMPAPFNDAVLVGGAFTTAGGQTHTNIARFETTSGTIHTDFASYSNGPNGPVYAMALQQNGEVVIGGSFTMLQDVISRQNIARLDAYSGLDAYFDTSCDGVVSALCLQGDGRLLVGGDFTHIGTPSLARDRLTRLRHHGASETLSVENLSQITWRRDGAAPTAHQAQFELSTDAGATWAPLAAAAYDSLLFTWSLTTAGLPTDGLVRARALTAGGQHGGSSSLVQSMTAYGGPPEIEVTSTGPVLQPDHSSRDLGMLNVGSGFTSLVFTISNTGLGNLSGLHATSITGPQATAFHIDQYPAPAVTPGNSTTLLISFAPRTTGPQTATLRIPNNDPDESGETSYGITLTGFGGEPITTWRQRHFNDTLNTGNAADDADADGDGIPNILEYATGADPTTGDGLGISISDSPSPPPAPGEALDSPPPPSGEIYFHYRRNKLSLSTVTFTVEWSDTLATNDWHTTGVTEQVTSEADNIQQVTATVPAGTAGRRFVRLKVSR